jgi:hypothetical protein
MSALGAGNIFLNIRMGLRKMEVAKRAIPFPHGMVIGNYDSGSSIGSHAHIIVTVIPAIYKVSTTCNTNRVRHFVVGNQLRLRA